MSLAGYVLRAPFLDWLELLCKHIPDLAVIERILSWLGLREPPQPGGFSPPDASAGPSPTYHPVPDIA